MFKFFKVKALDGSFLKYIRKSSELCVGPADLSSYDYGDVICAASDKIKNFLFVFPLSSTPQKLKLKNVPFASCVFPLGYEQGFVTETFSLYEQFHSQWLSFPPSGRGIDLKDKRIDDNTNYVWLENNCFDWEAVKLVSTELPDVLWINNILGDIELFFDKNVTEKQLIEVLFSNISNENKTIILDLLYPFTGLVALENFAKQIFSNENLFYFFKGIAKGNFWLDEALTPLHTWLNSQNRAKEKVVVVDEKFDFLQKHFLDNDSSSMLDAVNMMIRNSVRPTKKACAVLTVRNEGLYLLSWIAWHKSLGFEHFFIYSNNNDDGSDDLLSALAEAGVITWLKNQMGDSVRTQAKICKHAFSVLPQILDYEWALVCDADEYFAINQDRFSSVDDFFIWIDRYKTDAIGINWKYVASDDSISYKEKNITSRNFHFVAADVIGQANNLIKSIVKPRKMLSYSSHHGVWSDRLGVSYRLTQGGIHRYAHNSSGYSDDPMWADHNHHGIATIVHYHFKSSKEFLLRLYRGDALDPFAQKSLSLSMIREDWIQTYNAQYGKHGDRIPENRKLSGERLQKGINELLEIPNVRKAKANIDSIIDSRIKLMSSFLEENKDKLGKETVAFMSHL